VYSAHILPRYPEFAGNKPPFAEKQGTPFHIAFTLWPWMQQLGGPEKRPWQTQIGKSLQSIRFQRRHGDG
jgi:hypothetical protein